MKKIYLSCVIGTMLASLAHAADESSLSSLFEGTTEAESNVSAPAETEENGIFSFLNFKRPKKEEAKLTVADEKRLTPLEQTIKLADSGDVNAQLLLGYSYLYGENGAEVNYDKSFEYYAKAAMQNDSVGLNNLGSLYYSGIGVSRSSAKAAILFEKAANLGNAEAAVNLGFILISGNGAEKNPSLAMDYFEKAAEAKNPTAEFMLGYAYYTGKLRPQNYAKAAPLIRDAATAGFDEAQYILALIYMNGLGYPQNYGNAVKNLKLAVSQGSVEAMMSLGNILALGEQYTKDVYTAHVMFNLAAVRGAFGAADRRSILEEKMKIDEILQAQGEAERYNPKPSELSQYIRQTFGTNVRYYIDEVNKI